MGKRILSAVMAVLILAVTGTVTAESEIYAVYDTNTKQIDISGRFDSVCGAVTIMLVPSDVSKDKITAEDFTSEKYITKQTLCDKNGMYSVSVEMPNSLPSNVYSAYAVCEGAESKAEFSHVSDVDVQTVLNILNNAEKSDIETILTEHKKELGLTDDMLAGSKTAADIIYSQRPSKGYSPAGFMKELNRCIAISLIMDSENPLSVLKTYGANFGIKAAELDALSQDVTEELVKQIRRLEISNGTTEFLYECLLYAEFAKANSYARAEKAVIDYGARAGMDLSQYNTLAAAQKTKVMKSLYEMSPKSFRELYEEFKETLSEVYHNNSGAGSGGGGGGGSAFVGGGGAIGENNEVNGSNSAGGSDVGTSYGGFKDMEQHWSREYVEKLSDKGIIAGFTDDTFRPEQYVTRAEYIKLIISAMGYQPDYNRYFDDVVPEDWYFPYVSAGYANGIVTGYDNQFRPNDSILREEAAAILYRAAEQKNALSERNVSFEDEELISDYAKEAVLKLASAGIITGSDSCFIPQDFTKRCEASAMIYRLLKHIGGI